jgi:hypothetical protein
MKSILIITLCVLVCLASAKPKGPSVVSVSPQPDSSEETHTSGSSAPPTSSGAPNPSGAPPTRSGSRH